MTLSPYLQEVAKRRTFAIISHPDAGKTTITEKVLLFGQAIQTAGTVKGRGSSQHAKSDWMEMEKQRGISITTSVMQFPYHDCLVNLLDTPGHEDFSEDTYRTLTAVDCCLMVIDAAKGVEDRTRKLMEVTRLRDTPILTFMNKLDRDIRDPMELLDEVENELKIGCAPITWPIGCGKLFKGVYHLYKDETYLYQTGKGHTIQEVRIVKGLNNPDLDAAVGEDLAQRQLGVTLEFITYQLKAALAGVSPEAMRRVVIAYEPIWAIGTGNTATPEQAGEVCAAIRGVLRKLYGARIARSTTIQYGGSMNETNAEALLHQEDVDGGLIGTAALDPEKFLQIIQTANQD